MLRSVSRAIICRASSTLEITGAAVERFCRGGGGGGGGSSNLVESIQTTAVAATVAAATRTADASRMGLCENNQTINKYFYFMASEKNKKR